MKRYFFLFSLILICVLQVKAQKDTDNLSITDSTLVLGFVTEDDAFSCDNWDPSYLCTCLPSIFFEKGTIVVVSGVRTCKSERYFEIIYKNKVYYIKKEYLRFGGNIDYSTKISSLSEEQAYRFRENAVYSATLLHKNKLNEALKFLESCKTQGLAIVDWRVFDESEYTDGTSFRIEFYNPTKKVIKYITTTIVGYNPVGDKVYNKLKQSYNCQVKSVGPIKPDSYGSYSFNYVWFTDMVETAKIISIVVQYMDGTTKIITNSESIRLKRNLYDYMKND